MARVNLSDHEGRLVELAIEPEMFDDEPRYLDPTDGQLKTYRAAGFRLGSFVESPAVAFKPDQPAPEPAPRTTAPDVAHPAVEAQEDAAPARPARTTGTKKEH